MRGKRAPADRKAKAVGLALTVGVPDAAKAMGIPQRTIRDWKADPEFAELRLSARDHVAEVMWVGIQVGLEHIHRALADPHEPLKAKSETVAMLIEKRALLVGDATSRVETVSLTDGLDADTKRRLRDRLARAVRGESGTEGAGSISVGAGEPVDPAPAPDPA